MFRKISGKTKSVSWKYFSFAVKKIVSGNDMDS